MKSVKKTLLKLIPVILLLAALSVLALIIIRVSHHSATYKGTIPKESADDLNSPYCGWYHIYSYELKDNMVGPMEKLAEKHVHERDNCRLALLEFNLMNYREQTALSDDAIDELDLVLSIWSETDVNLIVRFLYDWDGNAALTEPENFYTIVGHLNQTAVVVNDYYPSVYIVQGAFIGDYGEMHDSRFNDNDSIAALLSYMKTAFDDRFYFAVRTPAMIRLCAGQAEPAVPGDALNRTAVGRIGLFNDAILGSETDLGTYAEEEPKDPEDFTQLRTRNDEIEFLKTQCLYVPNGGEVINNSEMNDFENAAIELSMTHVSYLNAEYDDEVITKWQDGVYETDDPYYGLSHYDYIGRHLGYRFVIRGASYFNPEGFLDSNAKLTLRVENTGFSNCYRDLSCSLTATNVRTGEGIVFPVESNPRLWHAGQITLVEIPLALDRFSEGETYSLSVSLCEKETKEPIHFANVGNSSYDCTIGTLSINSGFSFAK